MKNLILKLKSAVYSNPDAAKLVAVTGIMMAATGTAFADTNVVSMLNGVMSLIFGFFQVYGAVYLLLGIKAVSGAMADEGGQDQQALAKGKGQIIRGVVCVAAASIIELVMGVKPTDVGSLFSQKLGGTQ